MEEEKIETTDSQNGAEATENATEEEVESTESKGTDLEAEVKKATAPLYARMKQAEQEAKELKAKLANNSGSETKVSGNLSTKDIYALMEAKVPESDIEEVQEYANLKKISVSEALKSNVVKTILSDKAEQRNTANAANVGSSKRGSGKITDEALADKASKGEMPDSPEEIARLWRVRKGMTS